MSWLPVSTGHEITIRDGAIVTRNAKGRELASVPPKVKKTEEFEQLEQTLTFLKDHDAEAGRTVERWLQRGLPVPRAVIGEVWADEAWRSWLTDLVVATDDGVAGFLRDADADGLGVVDLDGESMRITAEQVIFPHPALIDDLDDMRELAAELGITQRLDQLFREVHRHPVPAHDAAVTQLRDWAGGQFAELRVAASRATSAGGRVQGGYATTTTFESGQRITALLDRFGYAR